MFFVDDDIDLLEQLIDENNIKVKEIDCLDYRDECICSLHTLLNSQYVHAETSLELIHDLKEKIS